jgi:hypothetical protein
MYRLLSFRENKVETGLVSRLAVLVEWTAVVS